MRSSEELEHPTHSLTTISVTVSPTFEITFSASKSLPNQTQVQFRMEPSLGHRLKLPILDQVQLSLSPVVKVNFLLRLLVQFKHRRPPKDYGGHFGITHVYFSWYYWRCNCARWFP